MAEIRYKFYECDNPGCGLRFPGVEGFTRWNRCPRCRSSTHQVAEVNTRDRQVSVNGLSQERDIVALLDNIRSAWNVGSIFRTSDGTGVKKIYCCGITPTPENSKVCKTSLGAEQNIAWETSPNAVKTAFSLKSEGMVLWAFEDLPGAEPLYDMTLPAESSPVVLIVGNEVNGVDPGVIELCDRIIAIPMVGKKQSYNVAIAYAIATSYFLYQAYTTARASPRDPSIYSQAPG